LAAIIARKYRASRPQPNLSQPPNANLDHSQALKHYYRFQPVSAIFKNLSLLLAAPIQPAPHGLTCV